jgi:mannitol/fructose-specific phosphotransferase system IIA component (Ntr-type)
MVRQSHRQRIEVHASCVGRVGTFEIMVMSTIPSDEIHLIDAQARGRSAVSFDLGAGGRIFALLHFFPPSHRDPVGAYMRLSEALSAERIVLDLQARTKDEAITELITIAAAGGSVNETPECLLSLILQREALTSTAVDKGVAIPHAHSPQIEGVIVSLGVHRQGLDFGGPDGDPVHLVFLVLSADSATGAYLSILGRTARIFRRPQILQNVLDASNVADILQLIAAHEPV